MRMLALAVAVLSLGSAESIRASIVIQVEGYVEEGPYDPIGPFGAIQLGDPVAATLTIDAVGAKIPYDVYQVWWEVTSLLTVTAGPSPDLTLDRRGSV